MRSTRWTPEQDSWLKAAAQKYSTYDELVLAFSNHFSFVRSRESIKIRLTHHHNSGLGRTKQTPYTVAEIEFLKANCQSKSLRELSSLLKEKFGRDVSKSGVGHFLSDVMDVRKSGRSTRIQKGEIIGKLCDIGAEFVNSDGYTLVKVANTGVKNADWKTKQSVVWQKLYGVPPDGIVVFLNRNRADFRKTNLYCLSRAIHAQMCANSWYFENREQTFAAIKLCELTSVISENRQSV